MALAKWIAASGDENEFMQSGVYPSCENAIYASRYLCSLSSLCKIM